MRRTVLEFLPLADVVKISDEELEFLTGTSDIEAALPSLFVGHVQLVLYTCGSAGAHAYTRTAHGFSASKPVKAVDTTAPGTGSSARSCGSCTKTGWTAPPCLLCRRTS